MCVRPPRTHSLYTEALIWRNGLHSRATYNFSSLSLYLYNTEPTKSWSYAWSISLKLRCCDCYDEWEIVNPPTERRPTHRPTTTTPDQTSLMNFYRLSVAAAESTNKLNMTPPEEEEMYKLEWMCVHSGYGMCMRRMMMMAHYNTISIMAIPWATSYASSWVVLHPVQCAYHIIIIIAHSS